MPRGRKLKNRKAEAPPPKPGLPKDVSALDFERFSSNVKLEPRKSDEEMSLMLKINKLKLEIQNLKELQQIQALRRTNNQLQMEVLKLRHDILISEPPFAAPTPENKHHKTTVTMNVDKPNNNDSINIRNVIYNHCDQNFVIKQSETPKPAKKQTTDRNFEENFSSIASTILSYISDKQDIETHTVALKQYTYELLKNEFNNLKGESESPSIPSPFKIKTENSVEILSSEQNTGINVQPTLQIPVPIKMDVPEPKPDTPQPSTEEDLHFSYIQIKPKIIEYLSDKVDSDTIVSAIRRLTKSKSKSLTRQPFEEHTKLLRVYLFQDKNILVQDVVKCQTEFAKDTYHSVRYYAVSLTKKTHVRIFPTKVPKDITSYQSQNTQDYVILQPLRDSVCRPKFRVDMIQDTMISEEFEFVSHNPFIIRPLFTDVVITSAQLNLLKPLVLQALADKSLSYTTIPVISITNNLHENEEFDDFPKTGDSGPRNLFRITEQGTSETNSYSCAEVKSDRNIIDLTDNEKSLKRQMEQALTTSRLKKMKISDVPSTGNTTNSGFVVNVDEIFRKVTQADDSSILHSSMSAQPSSPSSVQKKLRSSETINTHIIKKKEIINTQTTNLEHHEIETKYQLNFSIDLDSDEENESIVIN